MEDDAAIEDTAPKELLESVLLEAREKLIGADWLGNADTDDDGALHDGRLPLPH